MKRPCICLFIGPTLEPAEAAARCAEIPADVVMLPPVQQGDLLRIAELAPTYVCIVDGAFFQVPSVTHKEILLTLERGVGVLGAASLGALRAAELDGFGMEGTGAIYRLYKSGKIDGDDEVAVLHAPASGDFVPLSDPLVSIRHNLRRARVRRLISKATASSVLAAARQLHFTHRTYAAALAAASPSAPPGELELLAEFLRTEAVDLKRNDALELIDLLKLRLAGLEAWPEPRAPRTPRTVYVHLFEREYRGRSYNGQYVTDAFVLALYKLLSPSAVRTRRRVSFRSIAVDEARERGVTICESTDDGAHWLQDECLSADEVHAALRERCLEQSVLGSLPRGLAYRRLVSAVATRTGMSPRLLLSAPRMQPGIPWDGPLLREVKMSGAFRPMCERAQRIQEFAAETASSLPGLLESLACERLDAWAAAKWRISPSSLGHVLVLRGFNSYREFVDVARPAYVYEWLGPTQSDLKDAALAQQ